MMRRIKYYSSSIFTTLTQIKNWYALLLLLLNKRSIIIKLRNGYRFKVRSLMDVWIVKETCLDRDYESNSIQIQDGWIVIDIGAGIGEFAILVAQEHPNSCVYAYEPFPESFSLLEENLRLNSARNIKAFQIAIGSESGELMLATIGAAVQHTTTSSKASGGAHSMIQVQGLALDDLFRVNNLTHCDFMKIDCEGCEFEILFSASSMTLKSINHICLEYHDGFTEFSHMDLINYLQQNGFHVKLAPNPVHSYLGFLYAYR